MIQAWRAEASSAPTSINSEPKTLFNAFICFGPLIHAEMRCAGRIANHHNDIDDDGGDAQNEILHHLRLVRQDKLRKQGGQKTMLLGLVRFTNTAR